MMPLSRQNQARHDNWAEVQRHERCRGCRYDLKGLPLDGKCPECAERVSRTVPHCPRCRQAGSALRALSPTTAFGVAALKCSVCRGIAIERGTLRRAIQSSEARPIPPGPVVHDLSAQMGVNCGRCAKPMRGISAGAATLVDRCDRCGMLWLDADEMPHVIDHVQRLMVGNTPPANVDELLHQPDKLRQLGQRREARWNMPPAASNDTMRVIDWLTAIAWFIP